MSKCKYPEFIMCTVVTYILLKEVLDVPLFMSIMKHIQQLYNVHGTVHVHCTYMS